MASFKNAEKIIVNTRTPQDLCISNGHLMESGKALVQISRFQHFKEMKEVYGVSCKGVLENVEIMCLNNEVSKHLYNIIIIHQQSEREKSLREKAKKIEDRKNEKMEDKFQLFQNVLKTRYANDLNLKGLKEVQKQTNGIWLFFQQNNDGMKWMGDQPEDEIEHAFQLLSEHLAKLQILKIFKDLQSANPFTPAPALWAQAQDTYKLLKEQGIETHY